MRPEGLEGLIQNVIYRIMMITVNPRILSLALAIFISIPVWAGDPMKSESQTTRDPQFETKEVKVWKTTITPRAPLSYHRHDQKRIIVPLTDLDLTVKNKQGESHRSLWKKGKAYLLGADKPGELHVDINNSDRPMEVMVIQFKDTDSK